jgi:ABC-2 type transport system permease protein
MKTLRLILSVTWKEIQIIVRDRGSLAVLFLLPLIVSSLYGGINSQASEEQLSRVSFVTVGLVVEDEGVFGAELGKALRKISVLEVVDDGTRGAAEQRVADGEATAAIIIPADFSEKIAAYEQTALEVILDPADPERAKIVTSIMQSAVAEVTLWGEVQHGINATLETAGIFEDASPELKAALTAQNLGVIMTRLNEVRSDPLIEVASESMTGAKIQGGIELFFAHLFPAFTVMFVFFVVSMSGEALLREREAGTLRRLLSAPVPRIAVIVGKMVAYTLLTFAQVIVLFSIASIAFRMPLGQAPLALVVLTLLVGLCATSLGAMIASLAKSAKQADNIGTILGFALAGVGGIIGGGREPILRAQGGMAALARFTPHAHAVEAYYHLMAEKGAFADILPQLGILAAMVVVFSLIAAWRFRYEA